MTVLTNDDGEGKVGSIDNGSNSVSHVRYDTISDD